MKFAAKFHVMLNVPGKGIFSFGNNPSQQLSNIDGPWTYGPNVYNLQNDNGHCAVQVSCDTRKY